MVRQATSKSEYLTTTKPAAASDSTQQTTEKKQVLQYDVVLVQKQPVIETESYGTENIRDTKRFYPILGRDVHSGYESTCFLSEEDYKKREIGDTITMTRFIWK